MLTCTLAPSSLSPFDTSLFGQKVITIRLPGGDIIALSGNSLIHARGIRYARAARFETPHGTPIWEGVQDCIVLSPICLLNTPSLNSLDHGDAPPQMRRLL